MGGNFNSGDTVSIYGYSDNGSVGAWTNITNSVTCAGTGGTGSNSSGYCSATNVSNTFITSRLSSIPYNKQNCWQIVTWGQSASTSGNILATFNGDTTSGHYTQSGTGQTSTSAPFANFVNSASNCIVGAMNTGVGNTSIFDVPFYADTSFGKAFQGHTSTVTSGSSLATNADIIYTCAFTPTTAITSVTLTMGTGAYASGSKFMILVQD